MKALGRGKSEAALARVPWGWGRGAGEEAEVILGWRSPRSQLPAAPDIWSRSYPAAAAEPGLPACDERPQQGWGEKGEEEIDSCGVTDCSRTS